MKTSYSTSELLSFSHTKLLGYSVHEFVASEHFPEKWLFD